MTLILFNLLEFLVALFLHKLLLINVQAFIIFFLFLVLLEIWLQTFWSHSILIVFIIVVWINLIFIIVEPYSFYNLFSFDLLSWNNLIRQEGALFFHMRHVLWVLARGLRLLIINIIFQVDHRYTSNRGGIIWLGSLNFSSLLTISICELLWIYISLWHILILYGDLRREDFLLEIFIVFQKLELLGLKRIICFEILLDYCSKTSIFRLRFLILLAFSMSLILTWWGLSTFVCQFSLKHLKLLLFLLQFNFFL